MTVSIDETLEFYASRKHDLQNIEANIRAEEEVKNKILAHIQGVTVDQLTTNFGLFRFYFIDEKLREDPNYFYNQRAFFDVIWGLTKEVEAESSTNDDELEAW